MWKGLLNATKGLDLAVEAPADIIITLDEWDKIWSNYNPDKLPIWQQEYLKCGITFGFFRKRLGQKVDPRIHFLVSHWDRVETKVGFF